MLDPELPTDLYPRYQQLQRYVGWTEQDAKRVAELGPVLSSAFEQLIEDFYDSIRQEPRARAVITGGEEQIARLKGTLHRWLTGLFSGHYDRDFVARRWWVGWRHVDIGLEQVYTNVALSRLRQGLLQQAARRWEGPVDRLMAAQCSLNKLLDLDLAIIEYAYQTEYSRRQKQVEGLAAIGQVAGGIAHELRNPLNVVRTSVYYLLHAKRPTPEKTAEHLARIERQVGVADGVITALWNFARLPLPEFRPVDTRQCLLDALDNSALPENIELQFHCPEQMPPLEGDGQQLRIALRNLLGNARDAMPDGGRLSVDVVAEREEIEIRIQDTGEGIPPERLSRITEPLYTTKPRGIGLGLAITSAILDRHGAALEVDSCVGKGTTFTARFRAGLGADPARLPSSW